MMVITLARRNRAKREAGERQNNEMRNTKLPQMIDARVCGLEGSTVESNRTGRSPPIFMLGAKRSCHFCEWRRLRTLIRSHRPEAADHFFGAFSLFAFI